ncbi:MAG: biotin transporter BioY [Eubacteriales bacterium]
MQTKETIETISSNHSLSVKTITYIGLMTAILCILGPMSIPIGVIPMSLTNFAVFFIAVLLGGKMGTISVAVYLLLGAIGLPVFSGFTGGVGKLFGPTGGYLLAFLLSPMMIALCEQFVKKKVVASIIGMIVASIVIYILGSGWLAVQTGMTMEAAVATGVIPFLLFDAGKIAAVILLAIPVKKVLVRINGEMK